MLQALAKQIQTKYQSVTLDPAHKLHDDRVGIRREDQKTLNVIARCGRFTETCFKILKKQPDSVDGIDKDGTAELYTLFCAELGYLQDEYGCLFVSSFGDSQTAKLFRQLRKNTSSLPADAIEDLRCAAQVSAAFPTQTQNTRPQYPQYWRGDSAPRGRGYRGRFPRGNRFPRGRGYPGVQRPNNDVYDRLLEDGQQQQA